MSNIAANLNHTISQIPFGIRLIGLIMFTTSIHDALFSTSYVQLLGEISYKVAQGEIWRLFTATFVSGDFYRFLLAFILLLNAAQEIEFIIGTLVFLLDFFIKCFLINFLTFLFNCALWHVQPTFMSTNNYGLWPMIVFYYTSKCIAAPQKKVKIIKWELQNYIISGAIIGLIIFISTSLSIIVALQIAFIEQVFFNGIIIRLAPNTIQRLEQFRFYSQFVSYPCYRQPIQNLLESKPNRPQQIGTEVA